MEAIAQQLLSSSVKPFEKALTIQPRAGYSYKTTIESRQKQPEQSTLDIDNGCQVYINICYSDSLPAPKLASEDEIQKALLAAPGATYQVPLSLGQPRKLAGSKESSKDMIFDACIHTQPFIRSEHDLDFRLYLLELAMEHIEESICVSLSRQFIMLKVAAKGAPIPKRIIHLPDASGSVDSLVSRKLEVKKTPPPPIAPIVPQVKVESWSCQPLFKKENGTLTVILQMPSPMATPIPWDIQIDGTRLLVRGVDKDNVIDILLPVTIDVASASNRVDYYKKSGHLVSFLTISTVRERYL